MIKNKTLKRCTVAIMIAVLLTFTANKTVSVSAVAITGTVAAVALVATGAVYMSYLALTGAEMKLPHNNVTQYLSDIGEKALQYGTMQGIYSNIYSYVMTYGSEAVRDFVVKLTGDELLNIYNNAKDVELIQSQLSYEETYDVTPPANGYTYPSAIMSPTVYVNNVGNMSLSQFLSSYTLTDFDVTKRCAIKSDNGNIYEWYCRESSSVIRNRLRTDGTYDYQYYNSYWRDAYRFGTWFYVYQGNTYIGVANFDTTQNMVRVGPNVASTNYSGPWTFPVLMDKPIYIQSSGEIIETEEVSPNVYRQSPQWPNNHDNDNNYYPIVPYVELPSASSETYVPGQWGINMGELLDTLDELADDMVTVGTIGQLINAFKDSLAGTDTYNEYNYYTNEGNTYSYYYSDIIYGDNTYNINYNISGEETRMPVDLNTLTSIANNDYINTIKNTAADISQTVGDYVAFWHNVDYQTVYILLGGALFLLLCGLIGKMGK